MQISFSALYKLRSNIHAWDHIEHSVIFFHLTIQNRGPPGSVRRNVPLLLLAALHPFVWLDPDILSNPLIIGGKLLNFKGLEKL